MSRKRSFSATLSINIVLLTSVLFILCIGAAAYSSHTLIAEEAENSATHLLDATMLEIENTLKAVEVMAETASWNVLEDVDDPESFFALTAKMVTGSDIIKGFGIAFRPDFYKGKHFFSPYSYIDSSTGKTITYSIGNEEYDYFYSDWYLIPALLKKPIWAEPYEASAGLGMAITTYCYPVMKDDEVIAVIVADVPISWIAEITEAIKPYPNSEVSLFSITGSYIHLNDDSRGAGQTLVSLSQLFVDNPDEVSSFVTTRENGIQKFNVAGVENFMVHGTLSNGWKATIRCDYKEVLKRVSNMNIILVIVGLIGIFILFLICYFTVKKLTRPLVEFSQSAMRVAEGDFNSPLPKITSNDEIRDLRDSFKHMQRSLVNYIEELKVTTSTKERIESELNIASNIQMSMLPKDFPDLNGLDLFAMLRPAKEVGGDLYDFHVKGDIVYFAIGDVSGKGVPASMFMAITRSMFHFICSSFDMPIGEVVSNVNNACCEGNDTNMFVTFFAGKLNLKTHELEFCNAGHNPVVLVDSEGKASFMDVVPNFALGLVPDWQFEAQRMTFEHGSRLVLYTDGVTEAEAHDLEQYGEPRLLEWANAASRTGMTAEQAARNLFDNVKSFTAGNEQNDDITIMTIQY